ncbi:MAG: FkbM family methyltransferase [Syntrophobacteraceae bacterium]
MLAKVEFMLNRVARSFLPPKLRRRIADFHWILKFNELILGRLQKDVITPEGLILKLNPLFHGHLSTTESVLNYEPEVRLALVECLKPGKVVYDIGANIGIFSLLMSYLVKQNGKVYAVEPEMNNFKHLLDSIQANNLNNIIPMQIALGETDGVLQFDRRGGSFSGRIIDSDVQYTPTKNIVPMAIMSVDSLVRNGIADPPDLIKIDVEGFEGKVVQGMKEVLAKHAPVIVCELHGHLGDPSEVVYDALSSFGYSIFDLSDFLQGKKNILTTLDGVAKIIAVKDVTHLHTS